MSFSLKKGEVLGIAGMLGSGRTELLRCIFGADSYDSGSIIVDGKEAPENSTPMKMKKMGLGLTPEERKTQGVILIHSIRDNLCYASMDRMTKGHVINKKKRKQFADKQVEDLQIKIPDLMATVGSLSGGNQQKVVIGNWLNTNPKIMMYDEPSRGIDVKAKQQIFQIMWDQSKKGMSSIFVSSELEELLEVCHRILIMYMGRIVGEVTLDHEVTIDTLYSYCMGGKSRMKTIKIGSIQMELFSKKNTKKFFLDHLIELLLLVLIIGISLRLLIFNSGKYIKYFEKFCNERCYCLWHVHCYYIR